MRDTRRPIAVFHPTPLDPRERKNGDRTPRTECRTLIGPVKKSDETSSVCVISLLALNAAKRLRKHDSGLKKSRVCNDAKRGTQIMKRKGVPNGTPHSQIVLLNAS